MNDTFAGVIIDGSGGFVPLYVGQGTMADIQFCVNCEDAVWLSPNYGLKLWNTNSPPDWNSAGTWQVENRTGVWKWYNIWGSNKMDYWKLYRL